MSTKINSNVVSAPTTPVKTLKKLHNAQSKKDDACSLVDKIENDLLTKIHIVTPKANRRRGKPSKKDEKVEEQQVEVKSTIVAPAFDDKENTSATVENASTCTSVEDTPAKSSLSLHTKRIDIAQQVKDVYKIVNVKTGCLGGNGYNGAIYGELTVGSMQRVLNLLVDKCEMTHRSRFIDVGSGLGKPNLHAAQSPAVRLSLGVELETIRWQLAMHNLDLFVQKCQAQDEDDDNNEQKLNAGVNFIAGDIDVAHSLDPFTHIYMYDLGFPPPLQQSIARKFNNSVHARYLVSYRPPRRVIHEYGYEVEYVDSISTSMFGSGEGHTAYFYRRIGSFPTKSSLPRQQTVVIPKRSFIPNTSSQSKDVLEEENECVYCDEMFLQATIEATSAKRDALVRTIRSAIDEHLNSGRGRRVTRASAVRASAKLAEITA